MNLYHPLIPFLIAVMLFVGAPVALPASRDFDAAMERLLTEYSGSMLGDAHDKALLDAVFSSGTMNDFRAALWRCMHDPSNDLSQRNKWFTAIQLADTAGITRGEVASWARKNLELLVIDTPKSGLDSLTILFSGPDGTPQDVDRFRSIANRLPPDRAAQAKLINLIADSIRDSQAFHQDMRNQEKAYSSNATATTTGTRSSLLQTADPPDPVHRTKPTAASDETASSTPWSVVAVMVVAATGLLWLVLKKRK